MPSVYDPDNFAGRVNLAALYISEGRNSSRSFDTCFEMYDGAAVGLALMRRAEKNPDSPLARNLWLYLGREHAEANAAENGHRANLAAWARELRADGERSSRAMFAKLEADRQTRAAETYRTELTPDGEQLVIPGCERNLAPAARQLDLF